MFDFEILLQQILNGLVLGSVYALVALGYTMVYGILQLINFAHGDVLMVGAMVGVTVVTLLAPMGLPGPCSCWSRSPPRCRSACCCRCSSSASPTVRCATRRGSRR